MTFQIVDILPATGLAALSPASVNVNLMCQLALLSTVNHLTIEPRLWQGHNYDMNFDLMVKHQGFNAADFKSNESNFAVLMSLQGSGESKVDMVNIQLTNDDVTMKILEPNGEIRVQGAGTFLHNIMQQKIYSHYWACSYLLRDSAQGV